MRAVSMIASLLLLLSIGKNAPVVSHAAEVSTSAESAVLYSPDCEVFLYSKQADVRRPMASTTKIMTALVALEAAEDLDTLVTIPPSVVGVEGSSLYLKAGEQLTLRELLYGLLLQSANDAAAAIAYAISGSVSSFADLMNRRAAEMGLKDTHFVNPHGLDDPEHYTTARELALITAEAMKNEAFRTIVGTKTKSIPSSDGEGLRVLVNHNKLLRMSEDAIGVKTGFTKRSGRCLVGAASRGGVELITVTLDAPNDWNDHLSLFEYGFSTMEARVLAEPGAVRRTVAVINGMETEVACANRERITAILPKSASDPVERVKLGHFRGAPVKEGEVLGTVEYLVDGKVVASASLHALQSVDEIQYRKGFFS